jgi:PAS domain S-box-containing protein
VRTPSLRLRVVAAGVAVVAVVLLAVDAFVYLNLRSSLEQNLDDVLSGRAAIAREEARGRTPPQLASRLTELGLRAIVRAPDGRTFEASPPSPRLGDNLAPTGDDPDQPPVTRRVDLPDGTQVVVQARRGGVDKALRRLVALEAVGTLAGMALATLLLARVARVALRPLEEMAATARRAAAGHRGERLHPDRPHTSIGEMAAAYDDMLDALETALAEAQAAAAHSRDMEERSRKIVETATDAFVAVDLDGAIVDWNEGAERVFGAPRDDAMGRDAFETLFPPELRDEHRGRLEQLRITGERRRRGRRLETLAQRADGSTFTAELIMWATGEGAERTVNAFVHDLSERRLAEAARYRLAAIVDSSDDAIIGKDLDGTIVSWNHGAELMYGYTADEIVGRPITTIVPAERHHEVERALAAVRQGQGVPHHETVRLTRNGAPVEISLTVSPIRDATGAVVGASSIARDITEQRWLASTLDATLVALETALEEARASDARSRRFLADAAHQLRTPVAGIRACAETLLRGPPQFDRDRLLADMVRETSRASRLVTGLLRIARLDEGGELAPSSCDLAELCRDEAERAAVLAPDLEIVVDSAKLRGRPTLDADAVREILANLLDNARRHARRHITVTTTTRDGAVEVRVADDGPGVAAGMEERVFERFVSLDNRGGSGLGLPIARGLARAHGGDLRYEAGAFVLTVPLTASEPAGVGARSA